MMDSAEYRQIATQLLTLQQITTKTDGRDKFLKVIQYVCRVWLLQQTGKPTDVMKRLEHLVSAFSTTRKVIRLGHAVEPFGSWHKLVSDMKHGTLETFHALNMLNASLSVLNDISDDIVCLSKLQVLDKRWKVKFEPLSARLWFTCISLDLYTNYMEYRALDKQVKRDAAVGVEDAKVHERYFWAQVTLLKLLADAVFCSVDLNNTNYVEPDQVQAWSGMISGLLSFYKLWRKHYSCA